MDNIPDKDAATPDAGPPRGSDAEAQRLQDLGYKQEMVSHRCRVAERRASLKHQYQLDAAGSVTTSAAHLSRLFSMIIGMRRPVS